MISFDSGSNKFNLRIAGVAIHSNRILLHRTEKDDFWALPGGRNEFFEFSNDTLIREMLEETNEQVEIKRLLWIVENFFEYDNKDFHEIAFYYLMDFKAGSLALQRDDFFGVEGNDYLIFKWFDINKLEDVEIYPSFIKKKVLNLSPEIEHIMFDED